MEDEITITFVFKILYITYLLIKIKNYFIRVCY